MIRATTGGVMKTYRSNLMGSFINMNNNRNTVLSQRIFNSYAEDPAAAARAFRLRKSRMMVESQHDICSDVLRKYDAAVACLQSIDSVLCTKDGVYGEYMKTLTGTTLTMLNDPTGDARTQLNKVLDQMSQSIIQTMNQKYGDNFIFAGADGHNVPFEIKEDGNLYYRGIRVDASEPNVLKDKDGNPIAVSAGGKVDPNAGTYLKPELVSMEDYKNFYTLPDIERADPGDPDSAPVEYSYHYDVDETTGEVLEGSYIQNDGGSYYKLTGADGEDQYISKAAYDAIKARQEDTTWLEDDNGKYVYKDAEGNEYYVIFSEEQLIEKDDYEAQKLEAEKLDYLANEKYFVDIGYGFQEIDGKLIESSAFNASINGINFLGYGLDEDGDPKNVYSLVQKLKQVSQSVSEGVDWDDDTWEEFNRLVGKFETAVSNYQTEFVDLDASTSKLSMQEELLSENFYSLQEQYSELEDVDMVDAITSFIWAEYCYNAALKVGNSILAESLMDYLR